MKKKPIILRINDLLKNFLKKTWLGEKIYIKILKPIWLSYRLPKARKLMNEQKMDFDYVYQDLAYHMRFYIYLERRYNHNGEPLRYISSIAYLNGKEMEEIYGNDGKNKKYRPLPKPALNLLNISIGSDLFKRTFIGGNK